MTNGIDSQLEIEIADSWLDRLMTRWHERLGKASWNGFLSVTDQAVVSGTNFLTSVIVGRACGPDELGNYALGFTLYCLAVCVQRALISFPFTFYHHRLHGMEQRVFSGSTLAHLAAFGFVVMAMLGVASIALDFSGKWQELVPLVRILAVTFPLAFLVEFARRFVLARLEMTKLLVLDIALATIQLGGLILLASLGWLSAQSAYVVIGIATAIMGSAWLALARPMFAIRWSNVLADAVRNWRYGRWMLAGQLTLFARDSMLIWLVAWELGTVSAGIFAACCTFVKLTSPLPMAAANVLFPSAARAFADGDIAKVRRLANQSVAAICALSAPVVAILVFAGGRLLTKAYGEAFSGAGAVVCLLAFGAISDAFDTGATSGLFAIGRPNLHFIANLVGVLAMLATAVALVPISGILGAAQAWLIGRCLTTSVQSVAFLRLSQQSALRGTP